MNQSFNDRMSHHILKHAEAHGLNEQQAGEQLADHLATLLRLVVPLKKLAEAPAPEVVPAAPKGTGGGKKPAPHDLGDKATIPPDHNN